MPVPLVYETRSRLIENIHFGDLVVVNHHGEIIFSAGNPETMTYLRSTAKPFQVIPLIQENIHQRFDFTPQEIAIACASHYADDIHIRTVSSMLRKISCSPEDLLCGITHPLTFDNTIRMARAGIPLSTLHSDCSGKHAAMLAYCKAKGLDLSTYTEVSHPLQQTILKVISRFSGLEMNKIHIGVDGCTVPSFAMPLSHLAVAFARFGSPVPELGDFSSSVRYIYQCMVHYPEMIAGENGFCTQFIRTGKGRWIGKVGAGGVYGVSLPDAHLGIAVKISDGDMSAIPPVILSVMQHLKIIGNDEIHSLQHFHRIPLTNDRGQLIGEKFCELP